MHNEKEVYFDEWCPKCEYYHQEEDEEPCVYCLGHPANIDSHKPIDFRERK